MAYYELALTQNAHGYSNSPSDMLEGLKRSSKGCRSCRMSVNTFGVLYGGQSSHVDAEFSHTCLNSTENLTCKFLWPEECTQPDEHTRLECVFLADQHVKIGSSISWNTAVHPTSGPRLPGMRMWRLPKYQCFGIKIFFLFFGRDKCGRPNFSNGLRKHSLHHAMRDPHKSKIRPFGLWCG